MEVITIGTIKVDAKYLWHGHKYEIWEFYRNPDNVKAFKEWLKSQESLEKQNHLIINKSKCNYFTDLEKIM